MTATPEAFAAALTAAGGNVAAACRAIGTSRANAYARPVLAAVITAHAEAAAAAPPARLLPDLLKRAREARGVTNGEMARRLGIAGTAVSRLESQQWAPAIDEGHLTRWADALGLSLPELLAFATIDPGTS